MNTPATNMNNNAAYTIETARAQFLLDRVGFLKDVTATLLVEGTPEADAKIQVWLTNAYVPFIPLIVGSIIHSNVSVHNGALWAVANLLGADNEAVRAATKNALAPKLMENVRDYVYQGSTDTAECAAFLLFNYARFDDMSYMEAYEIISCGYVMGLKLDGEVSTYLLWAVNYAAEKYPEAGAIRLAPLIYMSLGDPNVSKEKVPLLLRLLGTATSKGGLVHGSLIGPLFTLLKGLLTRTSETGRRAELFWILSNVLTEPGAADLFFQHKELIQITIDAAVRDSNEGYEAIYALANFVTRVTDPVIQKSLACGAGAKSLAEAYAEHGYAFDIYDHFYQTSFHEKEKLRDLGTKGLTVMMRYVETYFPEMMGTDESVDDISEIIGEAEDDDTPAPCAYELLCTSTSCSQVVRHLVGLIKNAMAEGDSWVKVPLDTVLSAGDLVTLQHMGYVFDCDWLGVNPAIYSGY